LPLRGKKAFTIPFFHGFRDAASGVSSPVATIPRPVGAKNIERESQLFNWKLRSMPLLEKLKSEVCAANLELVSRGLVVETWGNLSGIDRTRRLVVIKPSGVPYCDLRPADMVVVSLESGRVVEGKLRPSSDTPTHIELYRAFAGIGGVAHTHSLFATAWAQARRAIPVLGTTHADTFHGPVPCTRPLKATEIKSEYERNTGKVIVETFVNLERRSKRSNRSKGDSPHFSKREIGTVPMHVPGVLVAEHGPFAWGVSVAETVVHAAVLERVAQMASQTLLISPGACPIGRPLLEKHFLRKHGPEATYGQKKQSPRIS
jgi:L-ribulose-5-phosphate 4-epimerase